MAFASFGLADTVYLKGGHIEKGEIIEDTADYIVVLDPRNLWKKVFYKKLIKRIVSDKKIDLKSYKKAGSEAKVGPDYAFVDTVYLKGGHIEKGEIIEDTADYIVVLDPRNLWKKVFYKKLIEKIESAKSIDLDSYTKPPMGINTEVREVAKAVPDYAFADTVYTKNGLVEKGEIIEDSEYYIVLLVPDSMWQKIFYKTLIEKIDSDKNIDLQSYKKSAGEDRPDSRQEDEAAVSQEGEKGAAKEKPTTGLRRFLENLFPFLK
jgi:sRNA-binding regulator protein Hfq